MKKNTLLGIDVYEDILEQSKAAKVKEDILRYIETNNVSVDGDQIGKVKTTYLNNSNFVEEAKLPELEEFIVNCCNEFLFHHGVSINYKIHSWLNVYDNSMSMLPHCHYNSLISGCYYVSMPSTQCGGFYIPEHLEQREQYRARYGMRLEQTVYIPKERTILLFEPWMKHGVQPNTSNEPRITVAFNAFIA